MNCTKLKQLSTTAFIVLLGSAVVQAQPRHHGSAAYNPDLYSNTPAEGKFSRMFDVDTYGLWPQASPIYDLEDLGQAGDPTSGQLGHMEESFAANDPSGDSGIEAGITFLGQFVDHDITLDVTTQLGIPADPATIKNFRTADLDLDCVYGGGPEATPWLYDFPFLHVGETLVETDAAKRHDLYRGKDGTALIGDPRNDENIFVAQIQASFIAFHNKMIEKLLETKAEEGSKAAQNYESWKQDGTPVQRASVRELDEELFNSARAHVIHYYHRMLAEYFLPKVIGVGRTLDIATNGPRFYNSDEAVIPVEFSAAAYRFGHSQVRQEYFLRIGDEPKQIFSEDRNGFKPLEANEVMDFALFFPLQGRDDVVYQKTRLLDTKLPTALLTLDKFGIVPPGGDGSLASRNLKRGRTFRLPSGQALFDIIMNTNEVSTREKVDELLTFSKGLPETMPLNVSLFDTFESSTTLDTDATLSLSPDSLEELLTIRDAPEIIQRELGFPSSPLWFHVLHEAQIWPVRMSTTSAPAQNWPMERFMPKSVEYLHEIFEKMPDDNRPTLKGQVLGPVGGTIVGEVLIGLMINYRDKNGEGLDYPVKIDLPGSKLPGFSDRFTYSDMLLFIGWNEAPI